MKPEKEEEEGLFFNNNKNGKKDLHIFFLRVQANLHLRLVSLLMNIKSMLQEHHKCVSKMIVNAKMTCRWCVRLTPFWGFNTIHNNNSNRIVLEILPRKEAISLPN